MCGFVFSSNVEALDVSAKSAVIIEANSRNIIFEKNAHEKLPMASTTKIMTSLITLEAGIPNDVFRPTDEMLMVEGTSMGLLAGDTVTVKNLVYGMLLSSGNDAANCAAIKVGGNLQNFAKIMNKRAKIIG
ncbi:MAG: D-alanyl-D-alanine carboxypeptidase, partial [Oscillospiraceae bacterium]